VTLEFSDGGTDYRLKKRFLENASSELFRKEDNKFVRLSEGEKADEFVRNLFSAASPGRGLSKPAHWGLAQVLLVPQGELAVPELSGNLVEDIQESLGVQVSGPGMGRLEEGIEASYLRFFTPTGKLKTGKDAPKVVELKDRIQELEGEQRRILEELEVFDQVSRRVQDLRAERAQAKRDAEALDQELAKARQLSQSYGTLAADRDLKQEQMKAASAQHAELKQRWEGIESARKELAAARQELERLKKDISERVKELGKLNAQAERAKSDLEEGRKGRQGVDKAERQAEDAERFVQAVKDLAELERRLQRIRKATQDLEAGKKELAGAVAPDAKALRAIRKALTARDEAQVRLDAALITLEIVPQRPGRMEILAAEETGQQEITPGTPVLVKGAPEVVVDLEGVARIRARGPAGTVEELREEVNKETRKLEALTAGFGTADIDELEARSEHFRSIQQKVSDAQTRLETLLSGTTAEEIEQESRKTERILEDISQAYPGWTDTPPDADSLRNAARAIKQEFISLVEEAELKNEKAAQAFQAANLKIAKLQAEHDLLDRGVKSISEKLDEMQKDGMDDRERAAKLSEISLEWDAAKSAAAKLELELNRFQDDPRLLVEKLEKQRNAIQDQASNALESLKKGPARATGNRRALLGPYPGGGTNNRTQNPDRHRGTAHQRNPTPSGHGPSLQGKDPHRLEEACGGIRHSNASKDRRYPARYRSIGRPVPAPGRHTANGRGGSQPPGPLGRRKGTGAPGRPAGPRRRPGRRRSQVPRPGRHPDRNGYGSPGENPLYSGRGRPTPPTLHPHLPSGTIPGPGRGGFLRSGGDFEP